MNNTATADRYYTVIGVHADGTGETQIFRRASALGEALVMAQQSDEDREFSTFGILPEDYEQARAEGIHFNEADGLLVD